MTWQNDCVKRTRQQSKNGYKSCIGFKQEHAPSISGIAKAIGKHRNTLQTWLAPYQKGGTEAMLDIKSSPGGVRKIPQWAEEALAKRLQEPEHKFASYSEVQQWLAETLNIEAEYHAVTR